MNPLEMLQWYLQQASSGGASLAGGLSPAERELFKGVERDYSGTRPLGMMPHEEAGLSYRHICRMPSFAASLSSRAMPRGNI